MLGWPKNSFRFFHNILTEKPNKLFSQPIQRSYHPRSRDGKEGDWECSVQRNPKSKSTPAARAARHSPATCKRTKACNVVLDHWHQNTMIILHSLDLSLFLSLLPVLPVLTLKDTESRRRGTWFPKWPPLSSSLWEQEDSESWHLPVFHASIFLKFKGNCFRGWGWCKYTPTDAS